MAAVNGDLPRWAVKALIWSLVALISVVGVWLSDLPKFGGRVYALEQIHAEIQQDIKELRVEVKEAILGLSQRIDRILDRDQNRRGGR